MNSFLFRSKILLSLALSVLAVAMFIPAEVQAASLSLSPGSELYVQECTASVNILLDTQGADTNAADVFITYNPNEVEILDQDLATSGIQIDEGGLYSIYAANIVDPGAGQIRSAAFDVLGSFNGNGVFATIVFQSKPGVTAATFDFDFTLGSSTDSNVADLGGSDVLTSVSNGSYTFQTGFCSPDNQAPKVVSISPANGDPEVPLNSDVSFTMTDNQSGIDLDTLEIQVHNTSYDRNSPELSFSGDPVNYDFVVNPAVDFPFNTAITVLVRAADGEGNLMSPYFITFNAPDTSGPFVTNVTPPNGANNVDLDSNVSLRVRDNDLGVDLSTVQIAVHGVDYFPTNPQVEYSGDAANYLFTINPDEDFPPLTEIVIVVNAEDLGGNVMGEQRYSFNRPPAPAVCGDNVVEGDEQCEPPGTLVCDDTCQISIEACLPEGEVVTVPVTHEGEPDSLVSGIVRSTVVESISEVFRDVGLLEAPKEVGGVLLEKVVVERFVCQDVVLEDAEVGRSVGNYQAPEGFEVIQEEVQFACDGALDTTINIPQEYYDVRAIKCSGGQCGDVEISTAAGISCGDGVSVGVERQPAQLNEINVLRQPAYIPQEYGVESLGEDDALRYRYRRYTLPAGKLLHSSLRMLSVPIEVSRTAGQVEGEELVRLTLPYELDPEIPAASVQLFAFDPAREMWMVVPERELRSNPLRVESTVNLRDYQSGDEDVVFAVMGASCADCRPPSLEQVYMPSQGSRAAVVLIHDLMGSVGDWDLFAQEMQLTDQPWQVWTYAYDGALPLVATAKDFMNTLQAYSDDFDVVYVVGHGVGGLIAQDALSFAHRENLLNPNRFPALSLVEKLVLVGTPSDVQAEQPLMLDFYNSLVNSGQGVLFGHDRLQELLRRRPQVPRVPGVEYFVVAGTKMPEASISLESAEQLESLGKHDGFVQAEKTRKVGGTPVADQCSTYWEVGASHLELPTHPDVRRVIGQLMSADLGRYIKEEALLGYQQYFSLQDATCSPEDSYVLIGKKIRREKAPDSLNCSCGNGFCGIDEDGESCPSDCASIVRVENYPVIVILVLLGFLGGASFFIWRRIRLKR